MAQPSSGKLKREELIVELQNLLRFDYGVELPLYHSSIEFHTKLSVKPWSPTLKGGGFKTDKFGGGGSSGGTTGGSARVTSGGSLSKDPGGYKTPWCINASASALGVPGHSCDRGTSCKFLHPSIVKPLSTSVKERLTTLAERVKDADFRGKFIAAIA